MHIEYTQLADTEESLEEKNPLHSIEEWSDITQFQGKIILYYCPSKKYTKNTYRLPETDRCCGYVLDRAIYRQGNRGILVKKFLTQRSTSIIFFTPSMKEECYLREVTEDEQQVIKSAWLKKEAYFDFLDKREAGEILDALNR